MRRTLTTAASEAVRLRFAPSPTGALHAGGARTALFNYLFARKCELRGCDATFMVRIDDSDSSRTVPGAEEAILSDLAWLGMRFGAPARCSDRDYASTVDQLLETGHAYRDFGSDRNWRDASDAEVRPLLADGVPHAVRFRVPRPDHPVTHVVEDAVRDLRWADVRRTLREDFVLVRRDGAPLYALCAVVCPRGSPSAPRRRRARLLDGAKHHDAQAADDARDGITHVVRAAEHASNALPQTLLLDALGAPRPRYAHCSLVVDQGASRGVSRSARTPSMRHSRGTRRRAQTAGSSRSGPQQLRPSPRYETTAARRSASAPTSRGSAAGRRNQQSRSTTSRGVSSSRACGRRRRPSTASSSTSATRPSPSPRSSARPSSRAPSARDFP